MMSAFGSRIVTCRRTMKSQVVGTVLLGISLCSGFCQPAPETNPGPVQAELLANLTVRRLESGAKIFAKVTRDWNGSDCILRAGSILEATVEVADLHKSRTGSRLALSFTRAQCNGPDLKPMNLLLAAVAQAPEDWRNVPDAEFKMPVMFMNPNGTTGFGGAGIGGFSLSHMELKGIIHKFPMSSKVQPGDVLEIKGMKLEIGSGPNRSSVLSAKNRDVSLDIFTQFLLVPASLVFLPGAAITPSSGAPETMVAALRPPLVPSVSIPVNDLEVCAPPGCAVDLPATASELEGHTATSIAIHPLGYAPRPGKVMGDFGNEETLAWLNPQQLLFAFNVHRLIRRGGEPSSSSPHRVIRAVLLNAKSHTVARAVDWEITDAHRYLWPLDGKHILVHVGNELRIYGADLEVERSIPLAGPLSFVRIAPNGRLMAIATLRERHSAELHAKLHDDLGSEPEEDIDVTVFDEGFKTIAQASTVSGLLPPTLLNEGQVNLISQPDNHYRLALSTWENKTVSLARFTSRCTPELSSVAPDLLFLLTCDVASGATEYRVLGADGKLLLRREAGPREVGQELIGNQGTGMFAIKVVRGINEISPGIEFKVTDLESEEVQVYRVADKKRLLDVNLNEPVASYDSCALSPDGAHLAVLSQSQIQFFPLAPE
jgi:hypothetical protein